MYVTERMLGVGLFSKKQNSKNWDIIRGQTYEEAAKTRDVHRSQDMERGTRGELEKPTKDRILAVILAAFFAGLGYILGYLGLLGYGIYQFIVASGAEGASFTDFDPSTVAVTTDWKLYAFTGGVFLIAWLIANEKFMQSLRSRNSMVDSTDINSHENDQHIMLLEEMQRAYDWFPDTGAHSSVQVSSLLSHVMIDRKGIKRVEVTQRHKEDVVEDGHVTHYKGEPIVDEKGNPVTTRESLIDAEFGQELFTASGIPVSQKAIRRPIDVRNIEYNEVDESGSRKSMDKLGYDTIGELINEDWEFPAYEVQRPAGAYLVDTAPVNTMVLAITRVFLPVLPAFGNRPAYL